MSDLNKLDFDTLVADFLANKFGMNEIFVAELCIAKFKDVIRCSPPSKDWMIFNVKTSLWERKNHTPIVEMIRQVLSELLQLEAQMLKSNGLSRTSRIREIDRACKANFIKGVCGLMPSFPVIHARSTDFDSNQWLVGLKGNKCIDLKLNEVRDIRPDDLLTKTLGCEFDPEASSEFWENLVLQWTNGDKDLAKFLQMWAGYSLSGLTREQAFLFLHGSGGNGKSVYINTLYKVMHDYADSLNPEGLMQKFNSNNHSPEIAKLHGARFVISNELPLGKAFDERLINNLTGGEVVTARPLYQGDISFTPQLKLILSGNHLPIVKGYADGFWRRIKVVSFDATFNNQDKTLNERLSRQLSGVLNWMLKGWELYQVDNRIPVPEVVEMRSRQYRHDMDVVQQWIDDCIVKDDHGHIQAHDLYESHRLWCLCKGLIPASRNDLPREFVRKTKAIKKRISNFQVYLGFKLLS